MQQSNQIWYLISRTLSGEASKEEAALLASLLRQNPDVQQQYEALKNFWSSDQPPAEGDLQVTSNSKISRILQLAKIEELLPSTDDAERRKTLRRRRLKRYLAFGSIAMAAIVFTSLWLSNSKIQTPPVVAQPTNDQVIATQNGSRTRTMLPDGTTVWLNAGSRIFFDKDFAGATREIKLEGEAYFDVVKNPHRPFIVHTSGIDIKVLGTVFNVKSYPTDKTVETTLLRGLVAVTRQGYPRQKPLYLHPNEKLVIQKNTQTIAASGEVTPKNITAPLIDYKYAHIDTATKETERIETAWIYNRLEFRGESFETLAGKMERWYNIEIVFDDDNAKHLTFNGSFEKETVEQALTALKTASPFNFTITGHKIHVYSL